MKISSILAIGGASADFCNDNNQQECISASMCTWNGSGCTISNLQATSLAPDITAALSNVMSGMMMADQQTASINTSGNSRLGSMINTIGFSSPAPASNSRLGGMGMFGMMAAQNSMFGMNRFMQCPFNVPYCERTACTMTPLSSSPLERDAFQCYSRPGCCFDEKLFVYRQAFGPAFFRGTPLCYRAIDNPIFNQLTQTSYHPTFLSSIVNTVIQANKNAYTNMQARNFIGCPPAANDEFSKISFIQKVAGNNWLIMSQLADEDGYNDFVEAVSPACGWSGIMEDECFLIGCCWNAGSSTCGSPLSTGISQERIQSFTTYKMYKSVFDDNDAGSSGKSVLFEALNPPMGGLPGVSTLPPFMGRKRRNARDRRQAGAGNMAMMSLLAGGNNGNNNNNFLNMALMGGGMGGSSPLFGGLGGMGGFGGLPGFGGNQGPAEICPSREVASSCMVSTQIAAFDFSQKMVLQESCRAKGCCWDEQLYSQMQWGSSVINNLNCPWRVVGIAGFPSLDDSVRGCCDTSPCVDRQARNGPSIQPVQPRRPQPPPPQPVEPMWTNWSYWSSCVNGQSKRSRSKPGYAPENETKPCTAPQWTQWRAASPCSKNCGGGTMSQVRNCTGMGCPQQTEYRDVSCNQHSCNRGGWGGFTPGFGMGK